MVILSLFALLYLNSSWVPVFRLLLHRTSTGVFNCGTRARNVSSLNKIYEIKKKKKRFPFFYLFLAGCTINCTNLRKRRQVCKNVIILSFYFIENKRKMRFCGFNQQWMRNKIYYVAYSNMVHWLTSNEFSSFLGFHSFFFKSSTYFNQSTLSFITFK